MKNDQDHTPISKKVGDKLERAGQKISNAGATKVGNFISRVGDKLEHSSDPKPDVHNPDTIKKPNT